MSRVQLALRVPDLDASIAFYSRLRLSEAGLATTEENDTTCCYALQDKVWVHGPGQEPWEVYVVKADANSLAKQQGSTCCTPDSADTDAKEPVTAGGCC
ncbi:hypothetical protein [Streptomyces chartreusis]|uniref:hypothetical protein n=1 Tax=Streptomyces chartreusis TaxID=1969 RepID=UPI00365EE5D4